MNAKNLFIVGWVVTSIASTFLIFEYYFLSPYMFIIGLAGAAFVGLWHANQMKTRDLVVLVLVSIIIAFIDEYAHTSSGVLVFFDLNTPSILAVMGWGLFLLVILSFAEYLSRTPMMMQLARFRQPIAKTLPALIAIICTIILVWAQGYLGVFDALLTGVYIVMGLVSLFYSQFRSFGWNLSILVSSVLIGGAMEFLGGFDGMWWYFYHEPIASFMVFTWALRTWMIFSICSIIGVKFK